MTTTLKVPFLAPIAVGTEIVVVAMEEAGIFSGWSACAPILVDRTTGVVYGAFWVPEEIHAGDLDVDKYVEGSYRSAPDVEPAVYRVASCLVRSQGGDHASVGTVLRLEPASGGPAYR